MTKKNKEHNSEDNKVETEKVNGQSPESMEENQPVGDEEPVFEKNSEAEQEDQGEQQDPVETLQNEVQEQKDKYLRLMAEFDNYKRRTSKEYERLIETANERLMLDIIEVRENFDRALSMADENHDFTKFLEGMHLIYGKLDTILTKHGLTVFTEIGEEFNPEIHNAMMKTPHEEIPEDHIVQIFEKGYRLKERVIKHANVIVSAGAPVQQEPQETEEKISE